MKSYPTNQIRNLAVIGHGDEGKTQLTSSLLYVAGATPRWGKVDEGTTTTDYDEDSIARKVTLNTALAHLEWRDHKVNLIDTPGYAAFVSHARPALRAADCALVVVHAVKGVEVQTEKTWAYANEFITPRIMVINQMDKEHADFGTALDSARHTFSRAIVPFTLPIGKEHNFRGVVDIVHMKAYEFDANGKAKEIDIPAEGREIVDKERERLVEVIAESDDKLMEKYFELGTLPEEDVVPNISRAIAASRLCPVFAVSSATLVGISNLLDGILDYAPAPDTHEAEHGKASPDGDGGEPVTRRYSPEEPFSAYVFRTIADPFAGRINVMKVVSGKVASDATVYNSTRDTAERLGALHVILEEDPSLHFDRDAQTKEFILSGSGQLHIETVVKKLEQRYHVEVTLHPPKVPYKETITQQVEVQGRHQKQSGGRGQFGDCKVIFEPLDRGAGFEWVDKIFGGAVPQNFRPAIEKGIIEAAASGSVAGYPLVDFRVTLIDGSYHSVDSDEHSFRAAGRKAFRAAMEKARPTLLEPIMDVEVFTPQEVSGDIMGDLNSRRGRVGGMEVRGKQQVIKAKVPLSEMLDYQSKLNSVTQARGSYHMQFSHYDPLPHNLADKVIQEAVAAGRVRAHDDDE